jgi:O-methyltransferase involved in polyketide biosynthesis
MKDFSSISPSARFLMYLKARTTIPFAKQAANILKDGEPETEQPELTEEEKRYYYRQLIHFENRYVTVDRLLQKVSAPNYVEISSGFSFRGLNLCLEQHVNFADTDLPGITETKAGLTQTLIADHELTLKGKLEVVSLNVLDEKAFYNLISRFPPGPVIILNEGLLVYLNMDEKCRLRDIIGRILKKRGGYWITGDIYIKTAEGSPRHLNEQSEKFHRDHQIYENRFESYAEAEKFFADGNFQILYKEEQAFEQLNAIQRLGDNKDLVLDKLKNTSFNRQSWCLGLQ